MKILAIMSVLLLNACHGLSLPQSRHNPDFWQRTDAPSQIYLQGPKAQHTLNHDIANCVVEVRELARLGSIRSATPPTQGSSYNDGFETPQYDGADYAAYYNYADFEGCMIEKGWQRVANVPYDAARRGARNFNQAVYGSGDYNVPADPYKGDDAGFNN